MKSKEKIRQDKKARRHLRIRAKVEGTSERPRLSVYRSLRHIYAQLIDDEQGKTLVHSSDKELAPAKEKKSKEMNAKQAVAFAVGEQLAAKGKGAGIKKVVFDRNGYKYHGRVKALAEGARSGGLEF